MLGESSQVRAVVALLALWVWAGCAQEDSEARQGGEDMAADPDQGADLEPDGEGMDWPDLPPSEVEVITCEFDPDVQVYVMDAEVHAAGSGAYALLGVAPLNTDGPLRCESTDPAATAGKEAVIRFTAPASGRYTFTTRGATTLHAASQCNISRQGTACAPSPHHLAPDFDSAPRVYAQDMRAQEVVHLTLETRASQPVDLFVEAPAGVGEGCGEGRGCAEGMVCDAQGRCGAGDAPILEGGAAWRGDGLLTLRLAFVDPDQDIYPLSLSVTLLDAQGRAVAEEAPRVFPVAREGLLEVEAEVALAEALLERVARAQVVLGDAHQNQSAPLEFAVEARAVRGEGEGCDPRAFASRCEGALACLPGAGEPRCAAWEAEVYREGGRYSYRIAAEGAQPGEGPEVNFLKEDGQIWFNTSIPYISVTGRGGAWRHLDALTAQTGAPYWERKGILSADDPYIGGLVPERPVTTAQIQIGGGRGPVKAFTVEALPVRGAGEGCDPDGATDRCEASQGCDAQTARCVEASIPVITAARWYGDPESGTLGFEVDGEDADGDVVAFGMIRVDERGEPINNSDTPSVAFDGSLSQFGAPFIRWEGARFTAGWSIAGWNYTSLARSAAWRLVLVDARGQLSNEILSGDAPLGPRATRVGGDCDPLGLRSFCGGGLVCEQRVRAAAGFVCLPDVDACAEGVEAVEISPDGPLVSVEGDTREARDLSEGTCQVVSGVNRPDALYAFTAPRAGVYHVWVDNVGDALHGLYARDACDRPHTGEVGCEGAGQNYNNAPVSLALSLEAGERAWVFVHPYGDQGGAFRLHVGY
jgi:hypothetical protein